MRWYATMDMLTFTAICIVVIPWQVLSFIIVHAIIRYIDAAINTRDSTIGTLIDQVRAQLQKNTSCADIIATVGAWFMPDPLGNIPGNIPSNIRPREIRPLARVGRI